MADEKNIVIIFDIINNQEQYALCLEFIKIIEKKLLYAKEELGRINEKLKITVGKFDKNRSPRYIEQPIMLRKRNGKNNNEFVLCESVIDKYHMSNEELVNLFDYNGKLQYQIRVHLQKREKEEEIDKSEFIHLQYMALLLRNLDELAFFDKVIQKRLMVFVVPMTGEVYPYKNENGKMDCDTYNLMSQYLRLVSATYNGVIYGATLDGKETVVTTLDYRKDRKYETYFPIILIDGEKYNELFDKKLSQDILYELFMMRKNRRFRNSRDEHPEVALNDFILETSVKHIREVSENVCQNEEDVKAKLTVILDLLLKENDSSSLQFSLFAFMLCLDGVKNKEELSYIIKHTWLLAGEVCQGIKQIVQNSIQYSQIQGCFLSFYLGSVK